MKIINIINEEIKNIKYSKFPLSSLYLFAKKFNNFKDFSHWYSLEHNHGYYWHLTHNKNFKPSDLIAPRDMSSMSDSNNDDYGALMITSDLEYWDEHYNTDPRTWKRDVKRNYVALFDATNIEPENLKQVGRGFGNEFYLDKSDAQKLKLIGIYDLKYAKQLDKKFHSIIPQTEKELYDLWKYSTYYLN
jgi:hypothetical protein